MSAGSQLLGKEWRCASSGAYGINQMPRRLPFLRRHFAGTTGRKSLALQGTHRLYRPVRLSPVWGQNSLGPSLALFGGSRMNSGQKLGVGPWLGLDSASKPITSDWIIIVGVPCGWLSALPDFYLQKAKFWCRRDIAHVYLKPGDNRTANKTIERKSTVEWTGVF